MSAENPSVRLLFCLATVRREPRSTINNFMHNKELLSPAASRSRLEQRATDSKVTLSQAADITPSTVLLPPSTIVANQSVTTQLFSQNLEAFIDAVVMPASLQPVVLRV